MFNHVIDREGDPGNTGRIQKPKYETWKNLILLHKQAVSCVNARKKH